MVTRTLKYREAISEGLCQAMERDPSIFVTGIGVDYQSGVFGTTTEALKRFGPERVFESPAMENALTGICIGAAAMGKRPVIVHQRNDFMFLALDSLINLAAKWKYMYGGNAGSVPIVVRAIVGKGWGQGATHSQSLHAVLGHFPGLRVAMPATPRDAKGVLCEALADPLASPCPTVIIEHRSLYETEGEVPERMFYDVLECSYRSGGDLTIVAASSALLDAMKSAEVLAGYGIDAEVIGPRFIRPLYKSLIIESVRKSGRLIVADSSWELCGFASEIADIIAENVPGTKIKRITWPDCPCPVSVELEKQFYPTAQTIVDAALAMVGPTKRKMQAIRAMMDTPTPTLAPEFTGPY